MDRKKLLIANSNEDFLLAMAQILEPRYHVLPCKDGRTALEQLRYASFDLIILDLMLPELDGLSLLECALREHICPPALALTPLLNDYVIHAVQQLEIRYLLRTPCDLQAVAARVEDLMKPAPSPASMDERQYLSGLLMDLGISPRLDGYRYLIECTIRFAVRPDQAFTKELYPDAGKHFGRSGSQVERSIRNALDITWKKHRGALWDQIFSENDSRPSSSEAISRLAELLRAKTTSDHFEHPL